MMGPDPLFSLFFVLIVIAVIVSFVLKIIGVFEFSQQWSEQLLIAGSA